MIEERWLDATSTIIETIDYTYDLVGRLLTATDGDSSLTYTYDARRPGQFVHDRPGHRATTARAMLSFIQPALSSPSTAFRIAG